MGRPLDTLTIKGFKSFQNLDTFALRGLNVLIGGNGAGKSNFIDAFRLLRAMLELSLPELPVSNLQAFINDSGGIDGLLFNGPEQTRLIEMEFMFGDNGYRFMLAPSAGENVLMYNEAKYSTGSSGGWTTLGSGHTRPKLLTNKDQKGFAGGRSIESSIFESVDSWRVYHFHDTGSKSPMRRDGIIQDNTYLRFNASNIAPFLLRLKDQKRPAYDEIIATIKLVAPFFSDFILVPRSFGEETKVNLSWNQKGSDYPMQPYHFSDGLMRFICLTTALLQPDPPSTLIIDEPELGLHPYAINVLAEMIKARSQRVQVVVSTQSPTLVDYFSPEDIVVVDRAGGASTLVRLEEKRLTQWLEEYSLGELWRKNILSGGPAHE